MGAKKHGYSSGTGAQSYSHAKSSSSDTTFNSCHCYRGLSVSPRAAVIPGSKSAKNELKHTRVLSCKQMAPLVLGRMAVPCLGGLICRQENCHETSVKRVAIACEEEEKRDEEKAFDDDQDSGGQGHDLGSTLIHSPGIPACSELSKLVLLNVFDSTSFSKPKQIRQFYPPDQKDNQATEEQKMLVLPEELSKSNFEGEKSLLSESFSKKQGGIRFCDIYNTLLVLQSHSTHKEMQANCKNLPFFHKIWDYQGNSTPNIWSLDGFEENFGSNGSCYGMDVSIGKKIEDVKKPFKQDFGLGELCIAPGFERRQPVENSCYQSLKKSISLSLETLECKEKSANQLLKDDCCFDSNKCLPAISSFNETEKFMHIGIDQRSTPESLKVESKTSENIKEDNTTLEVRKELKATGKGHIFQDGLCPGEAKGINQAITSLVIAAISEVLQKCESKTGDKVDETLLQNIATLTSVSKEVTFRHDKRGDEQCKQMQSLCRSVESSQLYLQTNVQISVKKAKVLKMFTTKKEKQTSLHLSSEFSLLSPIVEKNIPLKSHLFPSCKTVLLQTLPRMVIKKPIPWKQTWINLLVCLASFKTNSYTSQGGGSSNDQLDRGGSSNGQKNDKSQGGEGAGSGSNLRNNGNNGSENNNFRPNHPGSGANQIGNITEPQANEWDEASVPPSNYKHYRKKRHGNINNDLLCHCLGQASLGLQTLRESTSISELNSCMILCLHDTTTITSPGEEDLLCCTCAVFQSLLSHFAGSSHDNSCHLCLQLITLLAFHLQQCRSMNAQQSRTDYTKEIKEAASLNVCLKMKKAGLFAEEADITTNVAWIKVRKYITAALGPFLLLDVCKSEYDSQPLESELNEIRLVSGAEQSFANLKDSVSPAISVPEDVSSGDSDSTTLPSLVDPMPNGSLPTSAVMPKSSVGSRIRPSTLVLPINTIEEESSLVLSQQFDELPFDHLTNVTTTQNNEGDDIMEFIVKFDKEIKQREELKQGVTDDPYETTKIYGRKDGIIVSMPEGRNKLIVVEQMLSGEMKPRGVPGIGEVVYGTRQQLLIVARNWQQERDICKASGQCPYQHREEGVILHHFKRQLCILRTRYQKHHQWERLIHLGNGVTGKCHLCIDRTSKFKFCCKKMHILSYEDQELDIWSDLNHPNIVHFYGAIRHGEKIYMFAEFINGGSLASLIKDQWILGRRLSHWTSLNYFRQLLLVLDYLESRGILHEDIKADNLLLKEGTTEIVLADFGVAQRICHDHAPKGQHPTGSPAHWSPEKAAYHGHGFPSDLWAAACVLIHMLSGSPPWITRFRNAGILNFIIWNNPPPLEDVPANVQENMRDLIACCLVKDTAIRPKPKELLKHCAFQVLEKSGPLFSLFAKPAVFLPSSEVTSLAPSSEVPPPDGDKASLRMCGTENKENTLLHQNQPQHQTQIMDVATSENTDTTLAPVQNHLVIMEMEQQAESSTPSNTSLIAPTPFNDIRASDELKDSASGSISSSLESKSQPITSCSSTQVISVEDSHFPSLGEYGPGSFTGSDCENLTQLSRINFSIPDNVPSTPCNTSVQRISVFEVNKNPYLEKTTMQGNCIPKNRLSIPAPEYEYSQEKKLQNTEVGAQLLQLQSSASLNANINENSEDVFHSTLLQSNAELKTHNSFLSATLIPTLNIDDFKMGESSACQSSAALISTPNIDDFKVTISPSCQPFLSVIPEDEELDLTSSSILSETDLDCMWLFVKDQFDFATTTKQDPDLHSLDQQTHLTPLLLYDPPPDSEQMSFKSPLPNFDLLQAASFSDIIIPSDMNSKNAQVLPVGEHIPTKSPLLLQTTMGVDDRISKTKIDADWQPQRQNIKQPPPSQTNQGAITEVCPEQYYVVHSLVTTTSSDEHIPSADLFGPGPNNDRDHETMDSTWKGSETNQSHVEEKQLVAVLGTKAYSPVTHPSRKNPDLKLLMPEPNIVSISKQQEFTPSSQSPVLPNTGRSSHVDGMNDYYSHHRPSDSSVFTSPISASPQSGQKSSSMHRTGSGSSCRSTYEKQEEEMKEFKEMEIQLEDFSAIEPLDQTDISSSDHSSMINLSLNVEKEEYAHAEEEESMLNILQKSISDHQINGQRLKFFNLQGDLLFDMRVSNQYRSWSDLVTSFRGKIATTGCHHFTLLLTDGTPVDSCTRDPALLEVTVKELTETESFDSCWCEMHFNY